MYYYKLCISLFSRKEGIIVMNVPSPKHGLHYRLYIVVAVCTALASGILVFWYAPEPGYRALLLFGIAALAIVRSIPDLISGRIFASGSALALFEFSSLGVFAGAIVGLGLSFVI